MKKNVFLLVLLCSLIVISTLASKSVDNSSKKDNKSTRYLSGIRLIQTKQEFETMPNVESITTSASYDELEPMLVGSGNIGSKCIGSRCYGSACVSTGNCISPTGIRGH